MSSSWTPRITRPRFNDLYRTGIVGCGTIGSALGLGLQRPPLAGAFRVVAVSDLDPARAAALARRLRCPVAIHPLAMLIRRSDLVIEAASAAAAPEIVTRALTARRTVLAMSVGGLLSIAARLRALSRRGGHLLTPSGAIAGLDAVKAGCLGRLQRVVLTTRKPPAALGLKSLTAPRTLFRGSAARAVRAFPQNINVAATLALAGVGPARTEVRIIADPAVTRNIHEIEAVGTFGRLTARVENRPSRENPKTSQLAILSAQAALESLASAWRIGT